MSLQLKPSLQSRWKVGERREASHYKVCIAPALPEYNS